MKDPSTGTIITVLRSELPRLRAMAVGMCQSKKIADDVIEQFCSDIMKLSDVDTEDQNSTLWMYRRLRRNIAKTRQKIVSPIIFKTQNLAINAVTDILKNLRADESDALILTIGAGFSHAECAYIMDCKENSVIHFVEHGKSKLITLIKAGDKRMRPRELAYLVGQMLSGANS